MTVYNRNIKRMKRVNRFLIFSLTLVYIACAPSKPRHIFESYPLPPAPDYSLESNWAALPDRFDAADSIPVGLRDNQATAEADVFFVHPTTFLTERGNGIWNAKMEDKKLNQKTDASSIAYQASIFNGVGKIYAPRYRQAHYETFFTKDTSSARKALDIAYSDVRSAFQYFLEHYNKGRPLILAGHSQGALHLIRLLKEDFDDAFRSKKLVVAYIIGYPVPKSSFKYLKICSYPEETSCFCSWRTFKMGAKPKFLKKEEPVWVTNPLSWDTIPGKYVDKSMNLGTVLDNFNKAPVTHQSGVEIYKGILWADKPKFKFSFLYPFSNFHRGDMNIFYMNIRENAERRLRAFWK